MLATRLQTLLALALAASAAAVEPAYDYIIVGGGTAGVALATRLSLALTASSILLIEAGPTAPPSELRIEVPGMRGSTLGSVYDYNYTTAPQAELLGRRVDVNRGRVLGGSSAINFLCYDRAARAEYDAWAELAGSAGWGWEGMSEAMLRSENFTGVDDDLHGGEGPIRTVYSRVFPEQLAVWQPAMNLAGVETNERTMGGNPLGVSYQVTNVDPTRYTRSYAANSYLPLAGENLHVLDETTVRRVLFAGEKRGEDLVATGVELEDGTVIAARREVVLSGGTIGSPAVLERSGVGSPDVLAAAGIETLVDLPGVGENLQDHPRVSLSFRYADGFRSFDDLIFDPTGEYATEQLRLWLDGQVSDYDYTSRTYAFVRWSEAAPDEADSLRELAAEELLPRNSSSAPPPQPHPVDRTKLAYLSDETVPNVEFILENNYVGVKGYPGDGGHFLTILLAVMHPLSRGSSHVNATAPLSSPPVIDPAFLSSRHDLRALVLAAKYARRVAATAPLSMLWASEYEPGEDAVGTDDEWERWVRETMLTFYHPVGTCAMLPRAEGGVVSGKGLRVWGVANLRVVDAVRRSII